MNENISLVVSAIVASLLVVLIPLISILDRQDNMAYNVVLTYTTNFVDNVRSKGFIDKKDYEEYLTAIASTGNLYDVIIESHKKIIYEVETGKYKEDTIIYNRHDVEQELETNNIYKFAVGDEYYIKIRNTNIPSSSLIYNFLVGEGKEKIININYGGVVNKINQEEYTKSLKDYEHNPQIYIGVPKNADGASPVSTNIYENAQYIFDISKIENRTITLSVVLKNFNKFSETDNDTITVEQFKSYMDVKGLDGYNVKLLNNSGVAISNLTIESNGECSFKIQLSGIRIDTTYDNVSLIIYPELGESEDGIISQGKESVKFSVINDYAMYTIDIEGPFYENDNRVIANAYGKKIVYKKSSVSQAIYFKIKYTSIHKEESEIENDVQLGLNQRVGLIDVLPVLPSLTVSSLSYDLTYNYGTIKSQIEHDATEMLNPSYIFLKDGWTTAKNEGIDVSAGGKESDQYYIDEDDEAPTGVLIVTNENNEPVGITSSGEYAIGKLKINFDTKDITDAKSGLAKISISDGIKTMEYEYKDAKSMSIPWKWDSTDFPSNTTKTINYSVEDNVGNVLNGTLKVLYVKEIKSEFWLTRGTDRNAPVRLPVDTWTKLEKFNVHIDTAAITDFSISCVAYLAETEKGRFEYDGNTTTNTEYDKNDWQPEGSTLSSGIWNLAVTTASVGVPSVDTKKYKIDNKVPEVIEKTEKLDPTPDVYGWIKDVDVTLRLKDEHSGVSKLYYMFDENDVLPDSNSYNWKDMAINTSPIIPNGNIANTTIQSQNMTGEYNLYIKVKDIANNEVIKKVNDYIYQLDNKGPDIFDGSDFTNNEIVMNFKDQQSGLKSIRYYISEKSEGEGEGKMLWENLHEAINAGIYNWDQITTKTGYINNHEESVPMQPNKYVWVEAEDNLGNISRRVINMACEPPTIDFLIGDEIGTNEIGILARISTNSNAKVISTKYGWSNEDEEEPWEWKDYEKDINGNNIVGQAGIIMGSKFNIQEVQKNAKYYLYVKVKDDCENEVTERIMIDRNIPNIQIYTTNIDKSTVGTRYWMGYYLKKSESKHDYIVKLSATTHGGYKLKQVGIKDKDDTDYTYITQNSGSGPNYSIDITYPIIGVGNVSKELTVKAVDELGNDSTENLEDEYLCISFHNVQIKVTYKLVKIDATDVYGNSHSTTAHNNISAITIGATIDWQGTDMPSAAVGQFKVYAVENQREGSVVGQKYNQDEDSTIYFKGISGNISIGEVSLSTSDGNSNTDIKSELTDTFKVRNPRDGKYTFNFKDSIKIIYEQMRHGKTKQF